jgi:hypothetical protein
MAKQICSVSLCVCVRIRMQNPHANERIWIKLQNLQCTRRYWIILILARINQKEPLFDYKIKTKVLHIKKNKKNGECKKK